MTALRVGCCKVHGKRPAVVIAELYRIDAFSASRGFGADLTLQR